MMWMHRRTALEVVKCTSSQVGPPSLLSASAGTKVCVTACVCGFGNSRMAQFRCQKTIIRQGRAQRTPRHVSQHRVAHRWRQRRPRQLICRYGWGHAELVRRKVVPRGLEPRTLRLLAVRSNQLSYETICATLQF